VQGTAEKQLADAGSLVKKLEKKTAVMWKLHRVLGMRK